MLDNEELRAKLTEAVRATMQDPMFMTVMGLAALVFAFICCRVFARAGWHAGMGLLMLVPGVNLIMILMLGLLPWPIERELAVLRRSQKAAMKAEVKRQKLAA